MVADDYNKKMVHPINMFNKYSLKIVLRSCKCLTDLTEATEDYVKAVRAYKISGEKV